MSTNLEARKQEIAFVQTQNRLAHDLDEVTIKMTRSSVHVLLESLKLASDMEYIFLEMAAAEDEQFCRTEEGEEYIPYDWIRVLIDSVSEQSGVTSSPKGTLRVGEKSRALIVDLLSQELRRKLDLREKQMEAEMEQAEREYASQSQLPSSS